MKMRKKLSNFIGVMVIMSMIIMTGCGKQTVKEQKKTLFPRMEDSWIGDVMARSDQDKLELNYLYDTDHNGVGYHPIHRFYTKDLCTYEDQGEIIPFATEMEAKDLAVGTGCFIQDKKGRYHCFYTGHNDKAAVLQTDKECLMHAVSNDNKAYEKKEEDTIYAPEGYSTDDFRDPQIYWSEQADCYYMLVGARKVDKDESVIIRYSSKDMSDWKFEGDYYTNKDLYFMECPDLFKMGDMYYMVFSWNNVTYYRMSESEEGPWITPENDTFDGNAFYAAKTVEYQGKRYLAGFVDHKKSENDKLMYTWAGNLMIYELEQKADHTLGVGMPHQYEDYFNHVQEEYKKIEEIQSFGKLPGTLELSAQVTFSKENEKAGFTFGKTKENPDGYHILLDAKNSCISYDAYENKQKYMFEKGKTYNINVVVENEIIVIYVNKEKALSNRIYSAVDQEWEIYMEGNPVFENVVIKTVSK